MNGDNLYVKQPIKFYSEDLTLTKILLIKHHVNFKYKENHRIKPDQKYLEIERLLS